MEIVKFMAIQFDEIKERIAQDSFGKSDYITPVKNLYMDTGGAVTFMDTHKINGPGVRDIPFDMTEYAEGQMFSQLGMPIQYFRRIRDESPVLAAEHFNYWAGKADNNVMLRSRVRGNIGMIRGIVSEKFSKLDNDMMIDALDKILSGNEERFRIQSFYMDDKRMHLRVTYIDMTKQVGITQGGKPDYLQLGEDILNSEVGASSAIIADMIYRLVCSNGLKRWERDGDIFNQRHIHLRTHEFQGRMMEAMTNGLRTGQELLSQYTDMQNISIENPFNVIKAIADKGEFSQTLTEKMKGEYEGDNTAYGIVNAVTSAAKSLPNESRLKTEKFAGKLLNMKEGDWLRIDTVDKEETKLS